MYTILFELRSLKIQFIESLTMRSSWYLTYVYVILFFLSLEVFSGFMWLVTFLHLIGLGQVLQKCLHLRIGDGNGVAGWLRRTSNDVPRPRRFSSSGGLPCFAVLRSFNARCRSGTSLRRRLAPAAAQPSRPTTDCLPVRLYPVRVLRVFAADVAHCLVVVAPRWTCHRPLVAQ